MGGEISFDDVGRPSGPGEYACELGLVRVDGFHIAAWRDAPDARFRTILCTRVGDRTLRFALGQDQQIAPDAA